MKNKEYLHNMFNGTCTDDGNGDIETYENWLERQLLARIDKLEQLDLHDVGSSLKNKDLPKLEEYIEIEGYTKANNDTYKYGSLSFTEIEVYAHYIQFIEEHL